VRQVGEAACDVCRGGCELATAGVEGGGKLMVWPIGARDDGEGRGNDASSGEAMSQRAGAYAGSPLLLA
jgi:hypothetical protein